MVYRPLLIEVKFGFVSEQLPDDSDKLAGTVLKGIVVSPIFRHPGWRNGVSYLNRQCAVVSTYRLPCENSSSGFLTVSAA